MPAAGTSVARISEDRLKNSTPPLRTCVSRSVSEPSWLAGNRLISSRPLVASRMRSVGLFGANIDGMGRILPGRELVGEFRGRSRTA